jgi:hypothetical protein
MHVAAALDPIGGMLGVQEFPAIRERCETVSGDLPVGVRYAGTLTVMTLDAER